MTNLHAHVSRVSRDCDSTYSDSYIIEYNEDEIAEQVRSYFTGFLHGEAEAMWNDFSEIHFMNRVFANEAGPYAVRQARITMDEDGFDYDEQTEEGFVSKEVRWCKEDSCDTTERTHRTAPPRAWDTDMYCEDYPCCGHNDDDPCERQPYDDHDYLLLHLMCEHEHGICYVETFDYDEDDEY